MTGPDFKRRRELFGWTQRQAAEALGVTIPQISAIENGRSSVTRTIELLFTAYRWTDKPGEPSGWMTDAQWAKHREAHR